MVAAVETPVGDVGIGQPWVWMDDREAARQATEYLLGLGHQTVHYVAIPPRPRSASGRRAGGWPCSRRACRPRRQSRAAGTRVRATRQAASLAADPSVTAVLCGNDDLALGVMRAMHEAGAPIPESVSVVGFDDTPLAEFFTPALTTVRLDLVELGRACVAQLRPFLDPQRAPEPRQSPRPQLVVRESTGPAPASPAYLVIYRTTSSAQHNLIINRDGKGASRDPANEGTPQQRPLVWWRGRAPTPWPGPAGQAEGADRRVAPCWPWPAAAAPRPRRRVVQRQGGRHHLADHVVRGDPDAAEPDDHRVQRDPPGHPRHRVQHPERDRRREAAVGDLGRRPAGRIHRVEPGARRVRGRPAPSSR